MEAPIAIDKTRTRKEKPDENRLGFGKHFADHMFVMDYAEGKGWHGAKIIPYGPLPLSPATAAFHYGQSVFEGMKAYKSGKGRILFFRPEQNMRRLNTACERMCIPKIDERFCLQAIMELVKTDNEWIPTTEGGSLYIRPFIIACDPFLGVRPAHTYKFVVILSPVGAYYPTGLDPVKIHVETNFTRTFSGGTGYVKASGNYAASLKAQADAQAKGYIQVLWLDGLERKYVEEVGAMNVFFKIGDEIVTPALTDTILPGITRDSTIQLLKSWGMQVSERKISISEIFAAHAAGKLAEAFGTGTAAVISPIGELIWENKKIIINNGKTGSLSMKIYDTISGIQYGKIKDPFGWMVETSV
ncbi:MAG: branched-chain amino acid aminotransferase [Oligoflexales bacterium]